MIEIKHITDVSYLDEAVSKLKKEHPELIINNDKEVNKMDINKATQPSLGTWDKLPTEQIERFPKVDFEINITKRCLFLEDKPREYQGDNGAYYVFDVEEDKQKKVVMTSAWSLLRSLKIMGNLKNKVIDITKKMEKGKQYFDVKLIK